MDVIGIANSAHVITGGTDAPAAGTVETLTVNTAANFKILQPLQVMRVIDAADLGLTANYEIFGITSTANGSGANWQAIRGYEGTTPKAHAPGWIAIPVATPGGLDGRYPRIYPRPFAYNDAGISVGEGLVVPRAGDVLWDAVIELITVFNGTSPQLDFMMADGTSGIGILGSFGAQPISLLTADAALANNAGLKMNLTTMSLRAALVAAGLQGLPNTGSGNLDVGSGFGVFDGTESFGVCVSQDGTKKTPTAAALTATTAITATVGAPFIVTPGTNDRFFFAGVDPVQGGGKALAERFTVPGGSYTSLGLLEAAIMAATGTLTGPVDTFGQYVTVTDDGAGHLVFTFNVPGGAGSGCTIQNGGARDITGLNAPTPPVNLGITDPGNVSLENGAGGAVGGTTGNGILHTMVFSPGV